MCNQEIAANGWTSTPANAGAIFGDRPFINKPEALSLDAIQFPFDDPVVAKTLKYAKEILHPETFNHSMRVYFYGMAITKQQFPAQAAALNPATWALTCLLHDLGTAEENLTATRMSFDIYGGIKALSILKDFGATTDQAEAAAEAIIRHEDMGVDGTITYIGQLIQLATTYDNTGFHPHVKQFGELIHETTRKLVNEAYPRMKWCRFFAGVIRKEESIKPWCHSTHLVNFDDEIEGNTLMRQWE
ncbi:cyanamide hydratase [Aspergillus steynii IBT 23096]|uniref:Cyanamide hydratase n=1 Tax=Aspergillus steynii IBT 23096 TaxID=1392250 RepID=A0A2I2G8H9_9EURO|nr:cyanamide hydratase [Aspergillus steynii IBT 23096]PLB49190.1 cyanamide hydratase [Aspergillus steynii IBT 23096]